MDRNEWYKEQHRFEWDRCAHLLTLTRFCVGAAIVLGAVIVAAWRTFNEGAPSELLWGFVSLLGLASLSWLVGLGFLCGSVLRQGYKDLPNARQLENHFLKLEQWATNDPNTNPPAEFAAALHTRVVDAAAENFNTNRARGTLIHLAMQFFVFSLLLLGASAIPYVGAALMWPAWWVNFLLSVVSAMLLLAPPIAAWLVTRGTQPPSNGSGGRSAEQKPSMPDNTPTQGGL